jgi:hypothetical protein
MRPKVTTPPEIVQKCSSTIAAAARPYGAVRVNAAAAGPVRETPEGYSASIKFKVAYARRGGLETRNAQVTCRFNSAGQVVRTR